MSVRRFTTGLPGQRLPLLRQLLKEHSGSRPLRFMETHNGLTGMIVEKTTATNAAGETVQFDGMWSSSLTASTAKGKPDIEVVDTRERLTLVQETLSVTSKPMIYDADTGGVPEIFSFTVQALEDLGVSAAIIEDKTGLKQNSLFGTDRKQELEDIDSFCEKIKAGQNAKRSPISPKKKPEVDEHLHNKRKYKSVIDVGLTAMWVPMSSVQRHELRRKEVAEARERNG